VGTGRDDDAAIVAGLTILCHFGFKIFSFNSFLITCWKWRVLWDWCCSCIQFSRRWDQNSALVSYEVQ